MNHFDCNSLFKDDFSARGLAARYNGKMVSQIKEEFQTCFNRHSDLYRKLYEISHSACMRAFYEETHIDNLLPSKTIIEIELQKNLKDSEEVASELYQLTNHHSTFWCLKDMIESYAKSEIIREAELIKREITRIFYIDCRSTVEEMMEEKIEKN